MCFFKKCYYALDANQYSNMLNSFQFSNAVIATFLAKTNVCAHFYKNYKNKVLTIFKVNTFKIHNFKFLTFLYKKKCFEIIINIIMNK